MEIKDLAYQLDQAALNAQPVSQASLALGTKFTVAQAYKVQEIAVNLRYKRGERPIGFKLGFTSKAKMQQMGVNEMIYGKLTDHMLVDDGGEIQLNSFIHPRAEPEIAVLVKRSINRPLSLAEAIHHVEAIAPALEIIDSRYENFKFSLEDVVADNCSSAGLVLGKWQSCDIPIENLGMVLEEDQMPMAIGSSAAILGNPWRSFIAATHLAAKYEHEITEGSVIMLGAATPAIDIKKGKHIQARIADLGNCSFTAV